MSTNTNSTPEANLLEDIMAGQIWAETTYSGKIKLYVILDIEQIKNAGAKAPKEKAVLLCITEDIPSVETRVITDHWDKTLSIWYNPIYDNPPKNIDFKNIEGKGNTEDIPILGGYEA